MKELKIYEFQAKRIEDTLRIVSNIMNSREKKTCIDRDICQSLQIIKNVLSETIDLPTRQ